MVEAAMASKILILFTGILTIANGFPNKESFQCSRYCKEGNRQSYIPGKVYIYNYEADVKSLINGTNDKNDESGVHMDSMVYIIPLTDCDYMMQLRNTHIDYVKKKCKSTGDILDVTSTRQADVEITSRFEEYNLQFSFHNGKVDVICPSEDESKEIMEIKKAILSAFQTSMQDFRRDSLVYESDISGSCETLYEFIEENERTGEIAIKKTKNLEACNHRMSQYLSWQSVPYNPRTTSRSLPLLRSSLECTQIYSTANILKSSVCNEKHAFQPFSNGDNGALTVIKQQMTLIELVSDENADLEIPNNIVRTSLLPELGTAENYDVDLKHVMDVIQKLDQKTDDGVESDVPKLFSELVYNFQKISSMELLNIFNTITPKQRIFFIDAVSLVTTNSGVDVMKDLYKLQKITKKQMNDFISLLTFTKKPSLDTIISIKAFLSLDDSLKQSTILALSSIIHQYCKNEPNCLENLRIQEIMNDMEAPLINGCVPKGVDDHNNILLNLKGIGNAGLTISSNSLTNCYSNQNAPLELRLAAIAAHRKFSCRENYNLDDFNKYFANQQENTEIRIASYLASMQCASYALFAQVKDVFMKEGTNQVGSFVWTHLTNLQETSTQWKQGIKKILENEFLRNQFNTDLRKYSRNYEASTFFESVGAGGSVESNIIFTPESYIPRSAMLNFTLDLFGETINILEVGARIEGFEEIVENLFGPDGYLADTSLKNLLDNAKLKNSEANDKIKNIGDTFRAHNQLKKEPAGLLYANIFGNEISYTHFKNIKELLGEPLTTNNIIDVVLTMLRKNDIDFKKSFMFLDSSYTIPTMMGYPLNLAVNGTATLGLTVKGKIDIKDIWSYKLAVEGKMYPSASVQVVGKMTMDSFFAKTGIKYESTMNSNSYIDGHAFINGGKLVDLKINVPKKQMDVINIQSDIFMINQEEDYKLNDLSKNIENIETCTQTTFSDITGLKICYKMKYVNASDTSTAPYFPLTGGFKYSLNLRKTDTFDSYMLQIKTLVPEEADKPVYSLSLNFDTPNSVINRKMTASYHVDYDKLSLNATILSPFANIEIKSDVGNEFNKYGFQLQTLYNSKEILSVHSSFRINQMGKVVKYEPLANLNYHQKQIAAISGSLSYIQGSNYSADLKLEGLSEDPIKVIGDVMYDAEHIELRTSMSSKKLVGKAHAGLLRNHEGLSFTASSTYVYDLQREELLSLAFKINKLRHDTLSKDSFLLKFESSQKPMYNTDIQIENQRGLWFLQNTAFVTIFGTTWQSEQLFKFHEIDAYPNLAILCYLTCKDKNIDYRLNMAYNYTNTFINLHTLIQLNKVQRIESIFKYKQELMKEEVNVLIYYPQQTWTIDGSLMRSIAEDETTLYNIDFHGHRTANDIRKEFISIVGHYSNFTVDCIRNHKISCSFNLPESSARWKTPWTISSTLQTSKDVFLSISKLNTQSEVYVLHINSMEDTFSMVIQANDKRLMVINGGRIGDSLNVLLGLNIYQHFELSANLLLPLEKFDLKFYWDKDRDKTKKFVFNLVKNGFKGLYLMDLEYPNQKVTTALVLL